MCPYYNALNKKCRLPRRTLGKTGIQKDKCESGSNWRTCREVEACPLKCIDSTSITNITPEIEEALYNFAKNWSPDDDEVSSLIDELITDLENLEKEDKAF